MCLSDGAGYSGNIKAILSIVPPSILPFLITRAQSSPLPSAQQPRWAYHPDIPFPFFLFFSLSRITPFSSRIKPHPIFSNKTSVRSRSVSQRIFSPQHSPQGRATARSIRMVKTRKLKNPRPSNNVTVSPAAPLMIVSPPQK